GIGSGHIVNKLINTRVKFIIQIILTGNVDMIAAGLMPHIWSSIRTNFQQCLGYQLVDKCSAQTAAQHQQSSPVLCLHTLGKALYWCWQPGNIGTNRVPDHPSARKNTRESGQDSSRKSSQKFVSGTGHSILFVDYQWLARQPGRDSTRSAG